MSPKRKKVYIALIVICLVLSAGILYWGNSSPATVSPSGFSGSPVGGGSAPGVTTGLGLVADVANGYQAPEVFPAIDVFDTSVLDSPAFKGLATYPPLDAQGQIGRDNPFKGY